MSSSSNKSRVGLVLSGGGARGAYQAGVLKGIAEIAADAGISNPFPIITGISAGAINAAFLASECGNVLAAADRMALMWSELTADKVFKTDALSAGRSGFKLLTDATIGALYKKKLAKSLLDTSPLRKLLEEKIDFAKIAENLAAGHLDALSITGMNYSNSNSTAFVQADPSTEMWMRSRRKSELAKISASHVMASAALPLFFPPIAVGDAYFGDGCLRNNAPLSPAIHLGADRLLVVSVRKPDSAPAHEGDWRAFDGENFRSRVERSDSRCRRCRHGTHESHQQHDRTDSGYLPKRFSTSSRRLFMDSTVERYWSIGR